MSNDELDWLGEPHDDAASDEALRRKPRRIVRSLKAHRAQSPEEPARGVEMLFQGNWVWTRRVELPGDRDEDVEAFVGWLSSLGPEEFAGPLLDESGERWFVRRGAIDAVVREPGQGDYEASPGVTTRVAHAAAPSRLAQRRSSAHHGQAAAFRTKRQHGSVWELGHLIL